MPTVNGFWWRGCDAEEIEKFADNSIGVYGTSNAGYAHTGWTDGPVLKFSPDYEVAEMFLTYRPGGKFLRIDPALLEEGDYKIVDPTFALSDVEVTTDAILRVATVMEPSEKLRAFWQKNLVKSE